VGLQDGRTDVGDDMVHIEDRLAGHIPDAGRRPAHLWGRLTAAPASLVPVGFDGRLALGVAVGLRDRVAVATARAAAEARRRTRRTIAVCLAAILSLGGVALPASALVVGAGSLGGFEIDGNLTEDAGVVGNIDWANASNVTVIADDTIDSAFQGSSKELEPGNWVCQSKPGGVTPGKDNLLRAYVNPRIGASTAYLDLAFVKEVGEGDTHVNFEFNKSTTVTPYAEGPCGITRTVGDLLFTYDFDGTSTPVSTVRVWKWDGADWAELVLPVNAAAATNNGGEVTDPLNGGATIPARSFGELTVDLLQIPGFTPTCPGFATVNIRSRSAGSSWISALQDKMPTAAVDLSTCGSVKLKKVDDLGQPLAGARFGIYSGTKLVAECTTDAAGLCSIPSIAPGTYTVKEIAAPAGYTPDPEVRTITVHFREAVDLTGDPFENPLDLGAIKIVKTNDADGKPVAGITFQLLSNGTVAKDRDGVAATCTTGADGTCTIDRMVPGAYVLHEIASSVPATMTPVADRPVTITANQTLTVGVVDPVKPLGIGLTKLVNGVDSVTIHSGDEVTYTLRARNTGSVPIDVTSLTDNDGGPVLLPAACATAVAATTFIPVGGDQLLCTYKANPTKDVTNTGTVVGTDAFGRTATATDPASVDVIHPAITLVKTVNGKDALTTSPGTALSYKIVVTNTGDTPLTVTSFTDVATPGGSVSLASCLPVGTTLAVNVPVTCTYTGTAPLGGVTNTAVVEAKDKIDGAVEATDTVVVTVLSPGIAITKTVNGAEQVTVHEGDALTYVVTVENTGDAPIRLTDFGDVVGTAAATVPGNCATLLSADLLAPDGTRSCTYTVPAGATDRANTATIDGVEPILGTLLTASDTALVDVIAPKVAIVKTAAPTTAYVGDTVRYTLSITNVGTTDLTLSTLVDKVGDAAAKDILATCGFTTATALPVGGAPLTCSYDGTVTQDTRNVATVTAVDVLGGPKGTATSTDDAVVDVIHPAITLTKDVSTAVAHAGDTLTYTVRITNSGDTALRLSSLVDQVNTAPAVDILTRCGLSTATVLQPTEERTCTYDVVAGADDLTNTATVRAVDVAIGGTKGQVTAKDDAEVEVLNPVITIDKSASPTVVHPGDAVTYTLVVTNTGDTPLEITSLSDVANDQSVALSAECLALVGVTLQSTQQRTCTYVVPAGADDVHNVAKVIAVDRLERPVTDDDDADVEVLVPAIQVTKDVDQPRVHPGDTVTYTIVVTNIGDTPLRLTSLTDAVNGGVPASILATCDLTVQTTLDPGASTDACTYTAVAGTDDLVNVVVVRGVDQLGKEVKDDDDATVEVLNPDVTIDKTVDLAQVHAGDTLTYTLVVTNTGDTPLTVTSLDDAVNAGPSVSLTSCGIIGTELAAGASATCTYTLVASTDDLTNVATVVARDELQRSVDDHDDAVVEVLNPAITIVKTAEPGVVHEGDDVTYQLVVRNSGDTPVTITSLGDVANDEAVTLSSECLALVGVRLAVSAERSCTYEVTAGANDVHNVATVVAVDDLKKSVTDDDDADVEVIVPAIQVTKVVDQARVHPGDTVTYTIVVTNIGDTPLRLTSLTDAVNGGVPASILTRCELTTKTVLAPGASTEACEYSVVAGTDDLINVVVVHGVDQLGEDVTDNDSASVEVLNPEITIDKTVDRTQAHAGDILTYTLVVTNTGDTPLTVTSLDDAVNAGPSVSLADCGIIGTVLAAGASATCTYTVTAGTADLHNVATVVARDELERSVDDDDDADVDVLNPAITIVKTADRTSISGTSGTVTFSYLVTNTGDTALSNVTVTDDILGLIGTVARLEPGASTTLTKTATVTQAAPVNVGTVTGTDDLGKKVTDDDDAAVDFVEDIVLVRPEPSVPVVAPAPVAPAPLPRTGSDTQRQVEVALVLLVLGGLAVIPEHLRRRSTD
jgi:uncharacterized repeat protein (TIGR01451 family)